MYCEFISLSALEDMEKCKQVSTKTALPYTTPLEKKGFV